MKFKGMKYPVIIAATHVSELVAIEHTDDGIRFGGSVTITQLEVELKTAVQQYPGL